MLAQLQAELAKHIQGIDKKNHEPGTAIHKYCALVNENELRARLAVYQNNFYASLIEILQDAYPTLHKLIGEESFKALARKFIESSPPDNPLLFKYGEGFAEFIDNFSALVHYPYLSDVCRLDWMRHCAYYTRDEKSLSTEIFLQYDVVQIGRATLGLHPSAHMLASRYAVYSIWESNQQEEPVEINASTPENVLVFRTHEGIQTLNISAPTLVFLQHLQSGTILEAALEAGLDADENFDASSAVNFLVSAGLCTQIHITE